ncbi:Erythronate-4-phosphate dehydrogenase [Pseudoalteromonas luteoviolacea B = ATCC 29581]|nr:Erythronate-4-phosphate dehydrogenase [Pseudoalteromonas luteoviolacea B = ATCC 29581]
MKILADQNMPLVEAYFGEFGHVTRFDGRNVTPAQVEEADVLLVRSVTSVNEALLSNASKLKFVGTATIGVDHVDTEYLLSRDITFSSAPGCNAIAVAEYVISTLFAFSQELSMPLDGKTIGIIGVGSIGQCLREKLAALNVNVMVCDPLRYEAGTLSEHTDIDSLLQHADIITCHVPLVKSGVHKTKHLLNKQRLSKLKKGTILINASRGDVIDNQALLQAMQEGAELELALDVWENEPNILTDLLPYVRFASVHIAGHTLEGKARGTQMLYQALCEKEGKKATKTLADFLPVPELVDCVISEEFCMADLGRLVHLVYDVRRDDGLLRRHLKTQGFDHLRKNYPRRREFSTLKVSGPKKLEPMLTQLGFAR